MREKNNTIEKQFREAIDFLAQTVSGITSESTLRGKSLKCCPYFYKLVDVFESRPSARPRVTSDSIDDEENNIAPPSVIIQRGKKRPLALDEENQDPKQQNKDPVDRLLDQQSKACKQRAEKTNRMLQIQETQRERHQCEVKLEKDQANVDFALKQIQLQTAQREGIVYVLLARQKLLAGGGSSAEVNRLLPSSIIQRAIPYGKLESLVKHKISQVPTPFCTHVAIVGQRVIFIIFFFFTSRLMLNPLRWNWIRNSHVV
ncbi:hypothetical protein GN958_ATG23231 [Phytophthora infestans]|uniref:No apical meristem-associated C-terminal domain-containing protein n=1 Tax=Phytophthora infestans TaxID=4787 RepID=A0A8S9TGJ5_PHYIN|nr:hypothetical protein GN958_ATG23231 [Phytophthora infestans]